jgi:hypothetical protein
MEIYENLLDGCHTLAAVILRERSGVGKLLFDSLRLLIWHKTIA